MKRLGFFALSVVMLFSLWGCSTDTGSTARNFIRGDVTGEMNRTYSTQWFDFNVKSIKTTYLYEGIQAEEGYKYVVVRVSETNTFSEAVTMYVSDFSIDGYGISEEEQLPYIPFEGSTVMMPEEFTLDRNQTVEYDVVFEIPDGVRDIRFIYVEIDEQEQVGATFTILHYL